MFFSIESSPQSASHVAVVPFVFRGNSMKKNAGYTLIEILVTIGILSIISGVAYVSYNDQVLRANKNDLKIHAELFASSVKNCISINGGWSVGVLNSAGEPDGTIKPCNTDDRTDPSKEKDKLKSKLDFTCPADAECFTFTRTNKNPDDNKNFTCLYIEKEVSGKKLQMISRVQWSNPSYYQILCGEVTAYVQKGPTTCKKSKHSHLVTAGLADANGIKECNW